MPVDMGLPSGLLWSSVDLDYTLPGNVAETPFVYSKSFVSWGNIDPHNPTRENSFTPWNWGNVNNQEPWYSGQVYGSTPGVTLDSNIPLSMDIARTMLGSPWRMPSSNDFTELIANCDFVMADGSTVIPDGSTDKRVTVDGVVGIYLKSKNNGNLLFFACSGLGNGRNWANQGTNGYYWSSTFSSSRAARYLSFGPGGVNPSDILNRYLGFSIRPVYRP